MFVSLEFIKVFKMNDCDWYAGATADEAKVAMAEWNGYPGTPEGVAEMCKEFTVDPVELSAMLMNGTKFVEDDGSGNTGRCLSFTERRRRWLRTVMNFPAFLPQRNTEAT